MLADYHVHSHYSDDSIYDMEKVVQDAIRNNLDEICFTDHVDFGIKLDWHTKGEVKYVEGKPLLNVDYPLYDKQIKELKEKYKDEICLKLGLEFGVQTHTIDQFHKLFLTYDFDFIILSIHQVENLEFWTQDFQKGRTQKEYNDRYYQELYDVVTNFHDYSVIGHLDLIKRYDKEGIYPFEKNKEIIADILTYIIRDGKGIEVNTSSFRYGLEDLMPSMEILRLYYHLGGKIITIGSDSHKEEHLGAYLNYVKKQLKKIGYTHFCTFEKMKPIYHEIG